MSPTRRSGSPTTASRGARAAQGKLPTVGFLGTNTASAQSNWTAAFVQRLRELGRICRDRGWQGEDCTVNKPIDSFQGRLIVSQRAGRHYAEHHCFAYRSIHSRWPKPWVRARRASLALLPQRPRHNETRCLVGSGQALGPHSGVNDTAVCTPRCRSSPPCI
jgi:hypothetical protein